MILILLLVSVFGSILTFNPSSNQNNKPTNNQQTNNKNKGYQIKILNKTIPPGYVMGFPVDGGLIHGMDVLFLSSSSDKASIRFKAKFTGNAERLVLYAFAYKGQPRVRIDIREDEEGKPKETWLMENAYETLQLPSRQGFITVQLPSSVRVEKDRVYHILIEAAEDSLNGTAALRTYRTNALSQPLNPDDPDILWNDERMGILFYNGVSWRDQGKWPIFVIEYSEGFLEGQPYSLLAPWVVWGSTYVGQTVIPASDYKVGRIAFVISLKSGTPQDKLYYEIRDSKNGILVQGAFAEGDQLTSSQKWVEASLATPVTLKAGQLYRIVLLSPKTSLDSAYYLYGHEFSYNRTIGYGGLQHQLTSTLNGGGTWGENPDADAVFRLTTVE